MGAPGLPPHLALDRLALPPRRPTTLVEASTSPKCIFLMCNTRLWEQTLPKTFHKAVIFFWPAWTRHPRPPINRVKRSRPSPRGRLPPPAHLPNPNPTSPRRGASPSQEGPGGGKSAKLIEDRKGQTWIEILSFNEQSALGIDFLPPPVYCGFSPLWCREERL